MTKPEPKDKEKCRHGNVGECDICDDEMDIGNIM